jgi:hypothetical protein
MAGWQGHRLCQAFVAATAQEDAAAAADEEEKD